MDMKIHKKYNRPTARLIIFDTPCQLLANSGDEPEPEYEDANLELKDPVFDKETTPWL